MSLEAGAGLGVLAEAAQSVSGELRDGVALSADVRDAAAIADALQKLDRVDVVVNNAGVLRTGPLIDHDPEDFRWVLDINLTAVFVVAQAAARMMRAGDGGSIINVASINGIHPSPNCGAYTAAKAGVMGLTQQMADLLQFLKEINQRI